jgi:hypothetical protein
MNIEAVIQKTDLFDLVRKAGGELDTRSGRSACPIHGGSDTNAFHVYIDDGKQKWKCFTGDCGGGDCFDFVMKWRGWQFKQAYEFLGGETQSDPVEMKRLADERHERARIELEDKQNRMEAARNELRIAEKHLIYHSGMKPWAREMWTARGIDEGMQDFWMLGSCEDFVINGDYHTPTLTIPILDEQMQLLNIKHRLIKPQKPKDKYRPETSGLGAFPPLLAVPSMGYDGDLIIVVEGEIKAMVTWTRIEGMDIQVIGVAGKNSFMKISEKLKGKKIIVVPDPGGEKEAIELAQNVKGKILKIPYKIDDYILECDLRGDKLQELFKQARIVK